VSIPAAPYCKLNQKTSFLHQLCVLLSFSEIAVNPHLKESCSPVLLPGQSGSHLSCHICCRITCLPVSVSNFCSDKQYKKAQEIVMTLHLEKTSLTGNIWLFYLAILQMLGIEGKPAASAGHRRKASCKQESEYKPHLQGLQSLSVMSKNRVHLHHHWVADARGLFSLLKPRSLLILA